MTEIMVIPTRIKDFIAALQRRNEENLKIAIFDDCPASWAAARNLICTRLMLHSLMPKLSKTRD